VTADRERLAKIAMVPNLVALLRDVQTGKVARHRLRRTESPAAGQDLWQVPGHGPGGLQKCAPMLGMFRRHGLIHLPEGDPRAENWPWAMTPAGDDFLEHLDDLQREARAEASRWLDDLDDEERAMAADIAAREAR
jgi:hypothetical protein